ncbi:MAG: Fic family protein [Propionibacteriaceae bacterium]|nr:Fic family protein [Propionibacteriaceae bacterium]
MATSDFPDWESYFYPGTTVLCNLFDEHNQSELNELELMAVKSRSFALATESMTGTFDLEHLQAIHRHLFQDVYPWAGELRTAPLFPVSMVKGGPSPESIASGDYVADDQHPYQYFPAGDGMVSHLQMWFARLNEPTNFATMRPNEFATAIAEPWGEINAAHPFREGNTRAQIMFFTQFTAAHGHFLDYERFARDDWFRAKFNAGRFLVQHNTDTSLLADALSQVIDRRMTSRPRARRGVLPAYEPHYISGPDEATGLPPESVQQDPT